MAGESGQIRAPVAGDRIDAVQHTQAHHPEMELEVWSCAMDDEEIIDEDFDSPGQGERYQIADDAASDRGDQNATVRTDKREEPLQTVS